MECPVCYHPDLPDYQSVASTCPNCKSDLKGFRLIMQVEQENDAKLRWFKLLCGGLSITLIICFLGSFYLLNNSTQSPKSLQKSDSTEYYSKLVKDLQQELKSKVETSDVYYTIKRDDNLSEISKLFYNDDSHINQIMIDNNLQKGYNILPGDKLIIKLKNQKSSPHNY